MLGRYADLLQGQYYTEREGRYVLPVRSDAHLPVEGIVLGSSSSGGTLFVEPRELSELGNRLRLAEAEAAREEARVLGLLSTQVGELADPCEEAFFACIVADLCRAAARWAAETHSVVVELDAEPVLDLKRSRHPLLLLAEGEVIANDIRLPEHGALIISGPNAGGKTVALKTLGLVAWMARAGLPVPVDAESRLGFFEPVLCDIGDEQSIARSLSTFSAHVQSLARIVSAAGPSALVLLDEVAAGTDPEEGAALAAAVLEALVERGASVAVTTHYERLKELAAEHPRFENASVGFDFESMAPTFRLLLGAAGASSALAVAARHGLSEQILRRAHALLPQHAVDREHMLREIGGERAALERLRAEAELDRTRQRELIAELEAERHAFRQQAAREADREVAELRASVRSARKELETIRKELRKGGENRAELRELERGVSRIAAQVAIGSPLVARDDPPPRAADGPERAIALRVGQTVRHRTLGTQGELLELVDTDTARVLLGQMKLTVKVSELVVLGGGSAKSSVNTKRKPRSATSPKPLAQAHRSQDNTLDLRGERAEAAETLVDAFIDRMLGGGEPVGFVLHGHGTGALKALVREQLGRSSYIEHSRPAEPGEGGDAFTVFWLRD
ncbi:MAG TPA: Smr/MutS family protein [Polyangiaceae bacterium]